MAERSFDIYVGATFAKGLKASLQQVVDDYEEQREEWFVDKFGSEPDWQDFKDLRNAAKAAAQISSGPLTNWHLPGLSHRRISSCSNSARSRSKDGMLWGCCR